MRTKSTAPRRTASVLALGGLSLIAACDGGDTRGAAPSPNDPLAGLDAPRDQPRPPAPSAAPATPPQIAQPTDAGYLAVSRAIESGDAPAARRGLLALAPGLHMRLLEARLAALEGDAIGSVRAIEAARAEHPDQGAVYAAAAELHALAGRTSSAEDEIREGLAAAGETPELLRARGVLALSREGGARTGLGHLLAARAAAPQLEFSTHMLAEAYRLLASGALAARQPLEAAGFAREALALLPDDAEALELLADASAALGDFTSALATYERLLAAGRDLRAGAALMYARGATAALLEKDRKLALERYLRARELGADDTELGFGVNVLEEELRKRLEAGVAALERSDWTAARSSFEEALRIEPGLFEARNQLASALFRLGEFQAAATHWRGLLDEAEREGRELVTPVHLNLARALYQLGSRDEVRALLEGWLARHASSEHAAATREMLARLD